MRYCWQAANVLTSRRQKNMRLTFHTLPTTSSSLSPRLSACFCCSGLLVHCHHMYRLLLVRNPIHFHPVFPSSCSDSTSGSTAVPLFTVFYQLCCLCDHVKSVTLRSLSSVLFQFILGHPSFFLNSDEIHFNAWWTRCLGPNLCSLHVQPFDCFQHFLPVRLQTSSFACGRITFQHIRMILLCHLRCAAFNFFSLWTVMCRASAPYRRVASTSIHTVLYYVYV